MIECFDLRSDVLFAEAKAIAEYISGLRDYTVFQEINPSVSDVFNYLKLLKFISHYGMKDVALDELIEIYCLSEKKAKILLDKLIEDDKVEV